MSDPVRVPWRPIEALAPSQAWRNGAFGALEALRGEWTRHLASLTEPERVEVRQRSLRRLAIETGILERLYEVDWGLTLTLVAEGFTRDVVERADARIDAGVLATLAAQRDSLELVLDYVHEDRPLTRGFIKELHHAITRTQATYDARDSLGRLFERQMVHGEFKTDPNHVLRSNGTLLEYCPPEHVAAEIDRLIELYTALETTDAHPVVKSAWLHHRFVQIHPFADGNGRVARALTLLVLQRHRYAPLVVDRFHRKDYLAALDAANDGDLKALVRLFTNLEAAALTAELERPEPAAAGLSLEVAHTLAAQLAATQRRRTTQVRQALRARAVAVAGRLGAWFDGQARELERVFASQGVADVEVRAGCEWPPGSDRTHWFRQEVIESARRAGHYADLGDYVGWCSLRLRLDHVKLRYVASLHGAGRQGGVLAVTTFGQIGEWLTERGGDAVSSLETFATTADAFRFVHSESVEQLAARSPELEDLLDRGLTEALGRAMKSA